MLAIADALQLLGYSKIYHMREVPKNDHQNAWTAALKAKFEGEGTFGKAELDVILRGYEVSLQSIALTTQFRA